MTAPSLSAARREAEDELRAALRMRESQSWCGHVACDKVRIKAWALLNLPAEGEAPALTGLEAALVVDLESEP